MWKGNLAMADEQMKEIQELEQKLNFLIRPSMTTEEKIKALSDSFWRSHNAGYCDHIAGMQMGGIQNAETERHDLDCHYKWDVSRLLDLLKDCKEQSIDTYRLVMNWEYEYDKEGTWFDRESGKEIYELKESASYSLPHLWRKSLEIRSVVPEDDTVKAEIYVDYHTVTVSSDGKPVVTHASHSYSAAGDSVSQSLRLTLTIEKNEYGDRN